jgi:hypothetical protein
VSNWFGDLPPEMRVKVRDAFVEHRDLLQAFVDENPAHLNEEELEIVRSWRHLVHGTFYIFRQLKKFTVFLLSSKHSVAYGVLGLTDPRENLVGRRLPVMVQTVLLPFKGKIVYDGLLGGYNISFGGGVRRLLTAIYNETKARHGIVTSLPMSDEGLPQNPPEERPAPKRPSKDEKEQVFEGIFVLVDQFCREHLNEEYAVLCRKLAEKLARKRPSPLLRGSPNAWASGIVRTIGWINFLHDKAQKPYMRLRDIDAVFGIGESTGAAKLAAIRKMLKLPHLDPSWTLPSRLEHNPLAWTVEVNGFPVDVRYAPREIQEAAFAKGLIPYIPGERK